MKTIFDISVRNELISRIQKIKDQSQSQWGKMNAYQVVKHCRLWDEWIAAPTTHKQSFIGRIFGKMALRKVLGDEKPLAKNTPTMPGFKITQTSGDFDEEKKLWIDAIEKYAHFNNPDFIHTFFGSMTEEQIGFMAYKHSDHHLRQLGC